MLPKADLHIHTTASDGKLDPTEAVELAAEKRLVALSITDHDTFDGYKKAAEVAERLEIELIPGVEISTSYNGTEAHLLAYYFDPDSEYFMNFLRSQRVARRDRIKVIIESLNKAGLDINYDEVRAEANGANIGRPHAAKVLIDKGYVGNAHEAFLRYLSFDQLGELETGYPDIERAIKMVKEVGGAAILAHPGKLYSEENIWELIGSGLDGLECIHPSHNWKLQKHYTEIAEKNSLLLTGGSDFHGYKEQAYSHVGVVSVAMKHVQKMKRMTDQRKLINKPK